MSKKNAIDKNIETWTDEEVLNQILKFSPRVVFDSEFVQDQETGMVTHQILIIRSGEKFVMSEPQQLDWPLQPMPVPEAFEGKLN